MDTGKYKFKNMKGIHNDKSSKIKTFVLRKNIMHYVYSLDFLLTNLTGIAIQMRIEF